MLNNIRAATFEATDVAMTMAPDCLIMGMSAETFWDGAEGAERLHQRMLERTGGIPVMMGSTAVDAAIKAYGGIRQIGIITPYMPFRPEGPPIGKEGHNTVNFWWEPNTK